jgi:hypothetical protein
MPKWAARTALGKTLDKSIEPAIGSARLDA